MAGDPADAGTWLRGSCGWLASLGKAEPRLPLAGVPRRAAAVLVVDGRPSGPSGAIVLGAGGLELSFVALPELAGLVARVLGFVSSSTAANGVFAASAAQDLTFQ